MIDFTPILEALVALGATILFCVVIPYIKRKTTKQQQEEINGWIKVAVTAAEQLFAGQGRGQQKKAYVLCWLKDNGIHVDESKLDALIEAAVYELKDGFIPVTEEKVTE